VLTVGAFTVKLTSSNRLILPEMQNKDVRWKQRFQNFKRALKYLEQALDIQQPDVIQKAGLIQFFDMSFELAWNVVKD
jgi:hypothetical protein